MAEWSDEERRAFTAGCQSKLVQLVDRVLYDMRMQVANSREVAEGFMKTLEPLFKQGATQKEYEAVEPYILALIIERGVIPALAVTLKAVRDGSGLHNTQAEMVANSRRIKEQMAVLNHHKQEVAKNEQEEDDIPDLPF